MITVQPIFIWLDCFFLFSLTDGDVFGMIDKKNFIRNGEMDTNESKKCTW